MPNTSTQVNWIGLKANAKSVAERICDIGTEKASFYESLGGRKYGGVSIEGEIGGIPFNLCLGIDDEGSVYQETYFKQTVVRGPIAPETWESFRKLQEEMSALQERFLNVPV